MSNSYYEKYLKYNPEYKRKKSVYDKEYAIRNKESRKEKAKKYRDDNKDMLREKHRNDYYANKSRYNDQSRRQRLRDRFGLTIEEYNTLLDSQNGLCKICGEKKLAKNQTRMGVDHCHDTGTIRGILCNNCNTALGYFNDSVDLLSNAIKYILTHGGDIPISLKHKKCKI